MIAIKLADGRFFPILPSETAAAKRLLLAPAVPGAHPVTVQFFKTGDDEGERVLGSLRIDASGSDLSLTVRGDGSGGFDATVEDTGTGGSVQTRIEETTAPAQTGERGDAENDADAPAGSTAFGDTVPDYDEPEEGPGFEDASGLPEEEPDTSWQEQIALADNFDTEGLDIEDLPGGGATAEAAIEDSADDFSVEFSDTFAETITDESDSLFAVDARPDGRSDGRTVGRSDVPATAPGEPSNEAGDFEPVIADGEVQGDAQRYASEEAALWGSDEEYDVSDEQLVQQPRRAVKPLALAGIIFLSLAACFAGAYVVFLLLKAPPFPLLEHIVEAVASSYPAG